MLGLVLALIPSACGSSASGKPAKMARYASEAPARVVVVRTERFALRASMYVDLYATLLRGEDADLAGTARRTIDLLACDDERCAARAMAGDARAGDFESALPIFGERWRSDFALSRAAIERALPWLLENEQAIAAGLARDLALPWPEEPVVLAVTAHAGPRNALHAIDAPTVDVEGGCFAGAAILECAFSHAARSLAPSAARRALAHAVGRAVVRVVPGYVPEESRIPFDP